MANLKGNITTQIKTYIKETFKNATVKIDRSLGGCLYSISIPNIDRLEAWTKIVKETGIKNIIVR